MKQIWKFPLQFPTAIEGQEVIMPQGAKILSTNIQDDTICIWAEVDPDATVNEVRNILTLATGQEISTRRQRKFIDTVMDGPYVWHVSELYD